MHGSGGKPKWKLLVKVQLHNIFVQIKKKSWQGNDNEAPYNSGCLYSVVNNILLP